MRNLKKVIALVAVFAMLISTVAFAQTFTDVADTDNYAEAIETLNALGIITGDDEDGDGKMDFRPEDTITRAEVAAIVSRIQGLGAAAQTETAFNDVPSSHWASGYIAQAEGQGIVNGYGDGNFGPDDAVKYEEVVKMVMETIGYYPFAVENGGYPSGYTLAAQRYGVLEGVVGGSVGAPAPRGMVAQIVFNAIDTPIMDKATWGNNGEYVIYNDAYGDWGFMTLLSRDLDIVKFTGVVVENSYASLTGKVSFSADDDKTLKVDVDDTNDNINYLGLDEDYKVKDIDDYYTFGEDGEDLYQADVDADAYLGYPVTVYAEDVKNGKEYELVAISTEGVAATETITLDQYNDVDFGSTSYTIEYINENDKAVDTKKIANDANIIYNGVGVDTDSSSFKLSNYFGQTKDSALVSPDTEYSGQVKLIKTGRNSSAYDIVNIEIGVSAVVDEVTARGKLEFSDIEVPYVSGNSVKTKGLSAINCDTDKSDYMVSVTQDGDVYDYTTLDDGDVITILWNGQDDIYTVNVLGTSNYVDGYVASENTKENKYKIGDTWYKVAKGSDAEGDIELSSSGRFYIDAYGKIVALDDTVEVDGAGDVTTGNYAYVLAATTEDNAWGDMSVRVQILDKSGEIYEAYLAESVTLKNFNVKDGDVLTAYSKAVTSDKATVDVADYDAGAKALAAALKGNLITYSANSQGEIKTITMPTTDDEDKFFIDSFSSAKVEYDEDDMSLGNLCDVDDKTVVFVINAKSGSAKYDDAVTLSTTKSVVRTSAFFSHKETYDEVYAFDIDDNSGVAGAVVVLNENGGAGQAVNIAVINSVGTSSNGADTVYTVEYWMDGELQEAMTDADYIDDSDDIVTAERGDVFKLTVENGVITDADAYLVFGNGDKAYDLDAEKTPVIADFKSSFKPDESAYFAVVTKKKNSGSYTVVKADNFTSNVTFGGAEVTLKNSDDPNVYVYDPSLRGDNQLTTGSFSDITVEEKFFDSNYKVTYDGETIATPAYGMADYVFVRIYDGDVMDVVIYKNYEKILDNYDYEAK